MASHSQHSSISHAAHEIVTNTNRSRRNSTRRRRHSSIMLLSPTSEGGSFEEIRKQYKEDEQEGHEEIAIVSTGKSAGNAITPFLSKHIPNTYNPIGKQQELLQMSEEDKTTGNTKYCNRHRPDRKCRKQADGPSMEQMQTELSTLSSSDQAGISHVWSVFSAAPAPTRQLILKGLLSISCFPQLSYIAASVRDLIKIDFVSLLPTELSLKILCKLDTISLTKAAQVSRKWRQLADDDVVWHKLCEQHIGQVCKKCGWGLPLLEQKRLRQEKRQIQLRAAGRGINAWEPNITPLPESRPHSPAVASACSAGQKRKADEEQQTMTIPTKRTKKPWKDVYKSRFKISRAWKHGRFSLSVLKGHTNGVTCMQMRDNILCTGSYDRRIIIWDLDTKKELHVLEGHEQGIRSLFFDDTMLASGDLQGVIKVWDIRTGELIRQLTGPTAGILSIHFDGPWLVAGSMDHHIYVWNTSSRETYRLRGHKDFVNSVKIDKTSKTLLSASDDTSCYLWDLTTRQVLRSFSGHVGPVQQVMAMPPGFVIDESDLKHLQNEYDSDTDQDQDEVENVAYPNSSSSVPRAHRSATPPLMDVPLFPEDPQRELPLPFILTAGLDGTVRLWHVNSARCLRTFFGHLEGVWALACDAIRIVSAAEDGMVKVWNPLSGACEKTFTGHEGPVCAVDISEERLISGGEDHTVRVMEFFEQGGI